MSVMDLYGVKDRSHADVSYQIASLLQITFVPRDGLFMGEYDSWDGRDGEELKLVNNVGDPDDDMLHPEYPDYPVIFQVFRPARDQDLHERLLAGIPGLVHLSSTTW